MTALFRVRRRTVPSQSFHPLFMGPDYIGPAVDHFQEITAQFPQFWVASLLAIAFIEYNQIQTAFETPDPITGEGGLKADYVPGTLGFDPLNLKPKDEAGFVIMQTKELNNGRLAVRRDESVYRIPRLPVSLNWLQR